MINKRTLAGANLRQTPAYSAQPSGRVATGLATANTRYLSSCKVREGGDAEVDFSQAVKSNNRGSSPPPVSRNAVTM